MKRAERSDQNHNYEPSGKANFRPTTSNVNGPNQMTGQMVQQQIPLPQMSPSINTGYHSMPGHQYGQHIYGQPAGVSLMQMPLNFQGQVMQQPQQEWPGGPLVARPQTQYSHSQQQQQQYSQKLGFYSQSPKESSDPTVGSETNTGSTTPG